MGRPGLRWCQLEGIIKEVTERWTVTVSEEPSCSSERAKDKKCFEARNLRALRREKEEENRKGLQQETKSTREKGGGTGAER